jgi:cytochrome c5
MANFMIVLGILVLFAVVMLFVARIISGGGADKEAAMSDPLVAGSVEERIEPVMTLDGLNTHDPSAPEPAARSGEEVYALACQACHAAGVLGAPKTGDGDAWRSRLDAKGFDELVHNAIKGINAMPARGGNPTLTDEEIARSIDYMLTQSGVDSPYQAGATPAAAKPGPSGGSGSQAASTQPSGTSEPGSSESQSPQTQASEDPVTATPAPTERPITLAESVDPQRLARGENRYKMACAACHAQGVAGAPRLGDKAAWEGRLAQGIDGLVTTVINGKGAMPPRGGAMQFSNDDIRAAVEYMVSTLN